MTTITKYVVLLALSLIGTQILAQDTIQDSAKAEKIKLLEELKVDVVEEEKELLKVEVENINNRLDAGDISSAEADRLKQQAADHHAKNIENRLAIIDNKIELVKRNQVDPDVRITEKEGVIIQIGKNEESYELDKGGIYIGPKSCDKPKKYDKRTTSDLVFAIGFNNSIIEGQSIDDSPYKLGGSGFVELGWAWKTRVLDNSNAIRIKYGVSLQWNKLNIKDNQYFVEENDIVTLQPFEYDLDKAKFRMTNLVFPVHFEFGPSKKIEKENYFRYSTHKKFKIGIGGYAGFNVETLQKLKYEKDGDKTKDKIHRNYNTTDFVYGLSGYLAFGSVGVYVKYDLSPIFRDQPIEQNNISVGLRFDMD
ncbi:hypothetical protein [Mangrovimonas aestuarii]|uniref:hypothetical protein n=1 Tax=Mangrovimonas aestuarii TaxID=3018443 RepID=UPI002377EA9C|nr:hypothetical protein [Mangrovimonas aestuarii]